MGDQWNGLYLQMLQYGLKVKKNLGNSALQDMRLPLLRRPGSASLTCFTSEVTELPTRSVFLAAVARNMMKSSNSAKVANPDQILIKVQELGQCLNNIPSSSGRPNHFVS